MLQSKTINGRLYMVSIEPPSLAEPIGGKLAVYRDGRLIDSRDLYPHDSQENLFREGWEIAEHHANRLGV